MAAHYDLRDQTDTHALVYNNKDQIVAHLHKEPDGTWAARLGAIWVENGERWSPPPAQSPEDALRAIQEWADREMTIVALHSKAYRKLEEVENPGDGFEYDGITWVRAGDYVRASVGSGEPMGNGPSRRRPKYVPADPSLRHPSEVQSGD